MRRLLILVGVFVGLSSASIVQADEIDDMVEALNQKMMEQDAEGFGEINAGFTIDTRYPDYNYKEIGKQTEAIIKTLEPFGKPLNHTVIRRTSCGDRMLQIFTVFFAEQGQILAEYWFFRPQEKWSLSSVYFMGEGSGIEFIKKMKRVTLQIC